MIFLYLLLTLLLLSVLVFLHEGGHFLIARLNKITVNEFAIGMGPKILTKVSKKSGIRYSIRALPIGGFVSMAGEDEASDDVNAFCNKNVWRRITTVLAGPLTNLIVGFIGMFVLVALTVPATNIVAAFLDDATSDDYGLQIDDKIVAVNGVNTHTGNEVVYEITYQGYEPLDLTVIRDGEKILLEDVVFPTIEESGVIMGSFDMQFYGIGETDRSLGTIISHTFWRTWSTAKMVWDSLSDLIIGRFGLDAVSGPIGMTELVGDAIASGWESVLYLWVLLSVNLGVMNLLPLPALDGGRILFTLVECVIRKPLNPKFEGIVHLVGMVVLLAFMALITVLDVMKFF